MSALEIIEQIKALPAGERLQVGDYFRTAPTPEIATTQDDATMSNPMFQRANEHLFAHYGPLLQELAK
jgi:hypothetical protein